MGRTVLNSLQQLGVICLHQQLKACSGAGFVLAVLGPSFTSDLPILLMQAGVLSCFKEEDRLTGHTAVGAAGTRASQVHPPVSAARLSSVSFDPPTIPGGRHCYFHSSHLKDEGTQVYRQQSTCLRSHGQYVRGLYSVQAICTRRFQSHEKKGKVQS